MKVARITHREAEYTDLSGFDDQWYRDLILKALKEHGKLRRVDFDKLLIPKLPGKLSITQKKIKSGICLKSLEPKARYMWAKRNIGIYQNDKDNLFRTKSCDVLVV